MIPFRCRAQMDDIDSHRLAARVSLHPPAQDGPRPHRLCARCRQRSTTRPTARSQPVGCRPAGCRSRLTRSLTAQTCHRESRASDQPSSSPREWPNRHRRRPARHIDHHAHGRRDRVRRSSNLRLAPRHAHDLEARPHRLNARCPFVADRGPEPPDGCSSPRLALPSSALLLTDGQFRDRTRRTSDQLGELLERVNPGVRQAGVGAEGVQVAPGAASQTCRLVEPAAHRCRCDHRRGRSPQAACQPPRRRARRTPAMASPRPIAPMRR